MAFSGTFTPVIEGRAAAPTADPIADARELLHAASRLPYTANRSRLWSRRFCENVNAARDAVLRHIAGADRDDSPMSAVEREIPHLRPAIERQRIEHQILSRQADALCAEAAAQADSDIWRMIELGERATLLEMALARHHNRLVRLVYDTTHREFPGEAG